MTVSCWKKNAPISTGVNTCRIQLHVIGNGGEISQNLIGNYIKIYSVRIANTWKATIIMPLKAPLLLKLKTYC